MKKMLSIAALSIVLAAPAFAQDAKPVTGTTPAAPTAVKPDAGKVMTPGTTGMVKSPAEIAAEAAKAAAAKPAMPAAATPAAAPVTPPVAGKTVEAPKTDAKPMAVGAPKMDDKKMEAPKADAGKIAAPVAPAATPAMPAPADVKKQ